MRVARQRLPRTNIDVEADGGVLARHWGWDNSIRYGEKAWQMMPEVDLQENDYKIHEKRRYDAFHGTVLQDMLHELKVDTVVISGVMTNLCCETTARSAMVRDFNVIFLSDGTATCDPKFHAASLLNIEYGFGRVMTCAEFRELVRKDYKNGSNAVG